MSGAGWTSLPARPIIGAMDGEPYGRDAEVRALDSFLAREDPALLVTLLVGDPGIGKSTIWQRAVDAGRERSLTVLTARPAETEGELVNLVLGDLFRDLPASLVGSLPGPRRRALEAALLLGDDDDAPVDRRALGVAVATVLGAMADRRPVLIAIDDDQWIDAGSAATLAFALRRLRGRPIRVLLSRRAGTSPSVHLEGVAEPEAVARMDIGPLSVGAIQLLLRERSGVTLSRPVLHELYRVAGGNPFHALELARARSRDASRDLALPLAGGSIDRLLRDRLREIEPTVLSAALLVAAHGRTPIELLAALDVLPTTVDRAVEAGLLERAGHSLGFVHPLLAAAVYEGAGPGSRRAAHRRLAAALDDEVLRARHVALASAGPNAAVAAELDRAVRIARTRGQRVAAANLAERALESTPRNATEARHGRALIAARARLAVGDGERGRTLISGVLADVPTGPQRAEALLLVADLEPPATAVALLEEALRAADTDPRLRAAIHARLAVDGRLTHGRDWAERHAVASLRLTQVLDEPAMRARALTIAAMLRFEGARPGADALADEAYGLASRTDDIAVIRDAATTVGHMLTWSGEAQRARDWLVGRLERWRDRDEMLESECLWYLSLVELRSGHWEAAEAWSVAARAIRELYGVELPQDHLPAARIALHRGQFDLARQHSERALSLASGMLLPGHLAVLATIELWTGGPDRATMLFEQAEAAADIRAFREPAMRDWRPDYAEALVRAGRIDDAIRLVAAWDRDLARVDRRRERAGLVRARGLIAMAQGDVAAAIELLDDAAARHHAADDPFSWARARLAAGVGHRRLRQKRLARAAFEAAATTFGELGAASWLGDAQAELARLGGRTRIEGISPSERRVAELVAEGWSNRDIAAALFLTERTVASHLTHVYAKLGVRSRTRLAKILAAKAGNIPPS